MRQYLVKAVSRQCHGNAVMSGLSKVEMSGTFKPPSRWGRDGDRNESAGIEAGRGHCVAPIQTDQSGRSRHEDREPRCCLLVFIDNATSRLTQLRLVPQECTLGRGGSVS